MLASGGGDKKVILFSTKTFEQLWVIEGHRCVIEHQSVRYVRNCQCVLCLVPVTGERA